MADNLRNPDDPQGRDPQNPQNRRLDVKIGDEELKGRYANLVRVSHTREEFILDFINFVPPQGAVTARVMMSPGHVKRLVRALSENIQRYQSQFGDVTEAPEPQGGGGPVN